MNNKPYALVFHGFLGEACDFQNLDNHFTYFALDLKPIGQNKLFFNQDSLDSDVRLNTNLESWDQMLTRVLIQTEKTLNDILFQIKNDQQDTAQVYIFSYSMGTKVFMSIYEKLMDIKKFKNIKFKPVFLSSHFGIYNNNQDVELKFRSELNLRFLDSLKNQSLDLFLKEWSSLPLFINDTKIETSWSLEQINHYFKFWNQSQILDLTEKLMNQDNVNEVSVFFGELDQKYKEQASLFERKVKNIKSSLNANFYELKNRSHRILSKEDFRFIINKIKMN